MRITVFGAGAIGATVGAGLAEAGAEVSLVARGAHLAALGERGLMLKGPEDTTGRRIPDNKWICEIGPHHGPRGLRIGYMRSLGSESLEAAALGSQKNHLALFPTVGLDRNGIFAFNGLS